MAEATSATTLEQLENATRDSLANRDARRVTDCLRQWQTALIRFACEQEDSRVAAIRKLVYEIAAADQWSEVERADPSLTGRFGALLQLCDDGIQTLAMQRAVRTALSRMPSTLMDRFLQAENHLVRVAALSRPEREVLPLLVDAGFVDWTGASDTLVGLTAVGRAQVLKHRSVRQKPQRTPELPDRKIQVLGGSQYRRSSRSGSPKKAIQRSVMQGRG